MGNHVQIQSRALCVKCLVDGELPRERKGLSLRCRTRIPLLNNEEAITSLLSQQPPEFFVFCSGVFAYFSMIMKGFFISNKGPATTEGGLFFMQQKNSNTQRLVIMALLVAISIILSRFLSIAAWNLKIGFAFVPVADHWLFAPKYPLDFHVIRHTILGIVAHSHHAGMLDDRSRNYCYPYYGRLCTKNLQN